MLVAVYFFVALCVWSDASAASMFPPAPTARSQTKSLAALLNLVDAEEGHFSQDDGSDSGASNNNRVKRWFEDVYSSTWWLNKASPAVSASSNAACNVDGIHTHTDECVTSARSVGIAGEGTESTIEASTCTLPGTDALTTNGLLNSSNILLSDVINLFSSKKLPDAAVGMHGKHLCHANYKKKGHNYHWMYSSYPSVTSPYF